MPDYKAMYQTLLCETDTSLETLSAAVQTIEIELHRLQSALQKAEDLYIDSEE